MKTIAVSLALFILLLAAGCASPAGESTGIVPQATDLPPNPSPSQPTLTFGEDGCIYSGPPELPVKFDMTWKLEDIGRTEYAYFIVTLDEGKTLADLASVANLKPGEIWIHSQGYDIATSPGTYNKTFDLKEHANFTEGPIYFVCSFALEEKPAGVAGPIDVEK